MVNGVSPQAMLFASGFARPLPCGVLARRFFRSTRVGSLPQSYLELSRCRRGPTSGYTRAKPRSRTVSCFRL